MTTIAAPTLVITVENDHHTCIIIEGFHRNDAKLCRVSSLTDDLRDLEVTVVLLSNFPSSIRSLLIQISTCALFLL